MAAFAVWWLIVAIVFGALCGLGVTTAAGAIAVVIGCGLAALAAGYAHVMRARRAFERGARVIDQVRRFRWNR
jgi:hypothetical protein